MNQPLNVFIFGGCQTHMPLRRHGVAARLPQKYQAVPQIHTFGEMVQVLDILRGRKHVPQEFLPLCRMLPNLGAVPGAEDFADIDVALVEPSSPIELSFRGFAINRKGLLDHVLSPIRQEHGREANKIVGRWFRTGLVGLNAEVRAETEPKLLSYIQGGSAQAELHRAVIMETEAWRADTAAGFRQIRELIDLPLGVVIYVFRYMPDGRPISWIPGFLEEVVEAAGKLALPMFNPGPCVASFGAEAALIPDSAHYTEAFLPVIGSALANFAVEVAVGAEHRQDTVSVPYQRTSPMFEERDALAPLP
jgi:hypothetical protein